VKQDSSASIPRAGQAMTEFLIVSGMAWFMILGTIQLAYITNAHTMLKLAAFNAARAAIVERGDKPEDPVDKDKMRKSAQLAAWFSVIPVMPWVAARLPTTLKPSTAAVQLQGVMFTARQINAPSIAMPFILRGLLAGAPSPIKERAGRVADEYGHMSVKFYKAKDAPTLFPPGTNVDSVTESDVTGYAFDDRARADDGLVRVVVKWDFPLVIPFADRIVCAATRSCSQPMGYVDTNVPAWAAGTSLYAKAAGAGGPGLGNPFRIPLYATYVMRMQWDRKD
jgi:TadE-like protein